MQHTKFFKLLTLFGEDELKKADQFLASPYFNSSETLLKLFRYCKKYLPDQKHPKLKKTEAFRHLYGKEPFKENKLRLLFSRLTKKLREFLAIQELKKEDDIFSQLLIKSFAKKRSYQIFEREIEDRLKVLKEKTVRDTGFYKELLWLNRELFFHPDTQRTEKGKAVISEIMNCLDLFFVLSKLEFSSELLIRHEILSEKHHIYLLSEVIALGSNELAGQNDLIDLYIQVIRLQKGGLETHLLQKCIDAFLANARLLEQFEKMQLLHNLINLTLTALNAGKREYLPYLVRLYKIAVNNSLMLDKGRIAYTTFINVAILGAGAREFVWTKDFIEHFSEFIDKNFQDYATKMAWAFWYYQRGLYKDDEDDYKLALDYLSQISYASVPINLRIRSLLLRIYYDYDLRKKNNANVLLDHLDAFDKYISRNKTISQARAEAYQNMIRVTRNLARYVGKKQYSDEKLNDIKQEIDQMDRLVLKLWLLEKVEELQ